MKRATQKKLLIVGIVVLLMGAGYMVGTAVGMYVKNVQEKEQAAPLEKHYGISLDMTDEERKDKINAALIEGMKAVYIEPEIYVRNDLGTGDARISNSADSTLCVKCTLVRESTGEIVYDSDLIDPGYSIKDITLRIPLDKGYYPCTVVWTFYSQDGEVLLGDAARNIVLVVEK